MFSRDVGFRTLLVGLLIEAAVVGDWIREAQAGPPTEMDSLVADVRLNTLRKGEFFLFTDEDGGYWMRAEDFAALGLQGVDPVVEAIEGQPHIGLSRIPGLEVKLDPQTLTLELISQPGMLGRSVIDLGPKPRAGVYYPEDSSAFLNYRLGYAGGGDGPETLSLGSEVGLRWGRWLLLDQRHSRRAAAGAESSRLLTSLTLDRREELQRLTLGDFQSSSGDLGGALSLGGISLSKRYSMNPYQQWRPGADIAGNLLFPSTVEVFVEGVRVSRLDLPPGEFELQNLNQYGGRREVQLRILDYLGRAQTLDYGVYFSDLPLRQGLHEYSYDLGLRREALGRRSNQYGDWAALAFHRYGLTDGLTLGLRGEAEAGRYGFGASAALRNDLLGAAALSWGSSWDAQRGEGAAARFHYEFRVRGFSADLTAMRTEGVYLTLGDDADRLRPRRELSLGLGYGDATLGSLGLGYSVREPVEGPRRSLASLRYTRNLPGGFNLSLALNRGREDKEERAFYLTLAWYPGHQTTLSYSRVQQDRNLLDRLSLSKNTPTDEGFGYRLALEQEKAETGEAQRGEGAVEYNGPHGSALVNYRQADAGTAWYDLSIFGGLGYVDGRLGFSRPFADSFGLVRVPGLAGVRVYQNNQLMGRTDAAGELFVPNLSAFLENVLSIEDKDAPMDYAINQKERLVSPSWRSGSLILFDVQRIVAYIGKLRLHKGDEETPAEFCELEFDPVAAMTPIATGRGGEFYAENLPPGRHAVTLSCAQGRCPMTLSIPAAEPAEALIDLGDLTCELPFD